MPRQDKTGPTGAGPRTGRGFGPCGAGMGYGMGRGFGRFCGGHFPYPQRITEKEEKEVLNEEAEMLEEEIKAIKERLNELRSRK
jgi:hypothetical protein